MSKARNLRRQGLQQSYQQRVQTAKADIIEMAQRNYRKGHDEGYEQGKTDMLNLLLAGMCLASNELYGFGAKRCYDLMNKTIMLTRDYLTTAEAIQAVYDATGLELRTDDPWEAVTRTSQGIRGRMVSIRKGGA